MIHSKRELFNLSEKSVMLLQKVQNLLTKTIQTLKRFLESDCFFTCTRAKQNLTTEHFDRWELYGETSVIGEIVILRP